MKYLLDASAVLAGLRREPGGEKVIARSDKACLGSANLAEVIARLSDTQETWDASLRALTAIDLKILAVEEQDGFEAGRLRPVTKHAGLSLGDRLCLAMAKRRELIVLTSDRAFKTVEAIVGVEIELIR